MNQGFSDAASIATAVVVLAGIFVLVRPGSAGPGLISNIFQGFSGVIGAATGSGTSAAATTNATTTAAQTSSSSSAPARHGLGHNYLVS